MKEIFVESENKIRIAVNHYESGVRESVVIICPGCFICKDAKPFRMMSEDFYKVYDVITMDFRGHGRSSGLFTFTAREYNDLRSVVVYAKNFYKRIGILGFSLGAASAIIYTAKFKDVDSLIAVAPPVSFRKIENHFWKKNTLIAAIKKYELWKNPSIRPGNIFLKKDNPIDLVGDISPIPFLVITGTDDTIIYPWHCIELNKWSGEPKKMFIFDKGLHAEQLYLKQCEIFMGVCKDWFTTYLG